MNYTKLDLIQGSPEWLAARRNYLTASDSSCLFELNPYKTKLQLFEEKAFGKEQPISDTKQTLFNIGHKAEEAGRNWYHKHFGIELKPAVLVSVPHPDILASLDGLNESKGFIFEAKYIGQEALDEVKKGNIKPNHDCQVQTQLLVSGAEKCVYFGLAPNGDAAIVDVYPNKDLQRDIAEAAAKFMADVRAGDAPEPSMRDFYTPEDPRFEMLRKLKEQGDQAADDFEALKRELTEHYSSYARIRAGGLTITRSFRKGAIQYAKIPQLKGVDLEKYRAKASETVTVRLDKKEFT